MLLRVNNIPWLSISKLRASSAKIVYSNRAFGQNNRVDQKNNNMQWYLHIVKAQKNSKSGWTVQGIVQSVSEFRCLSCFSAAVAKENLFKTLAIVLLANFQIFKFCCDIQGSRLSGYLWVSLIIDQSECLICYFLCTELTLFCTELTLFYTELPENCFYLNNQNWLIFPCILLIEI